MIYFENVLGGYRSTAKDYALVPGTQVTPALAALKGALPALLIGQIAEGARSLDDYRCYGGYGDPNRTFAKIPWVACCHRSVTSNVKDGYFIVVLFRADMMGFWLSLNQGYTHYKAAYVNDTRARQQARQAAATLAKMTELPAGFQTGPIDLAAPTNLGKGYEAGAIVVDFMPPPRSHQSKILQQILPVYSGFTTLCVAR